MEWLERNVPKMVLAPSFVAIMIFVYGFIAWTAWISFTKSRLMPRNTTSALPAGQVSRRFCRS